MCPHRILRHFPRAKIIAIIRDPRAVAASTRRETGASLWRSALRWKLSVRAVCHNTSSLPPERFCPVFYEDLIREPVATFNRILEFLEEPVKDSAAKLRLHSEDWGYGGTTAYGGLSAADKGTVFDKRLDSYTQELTAKEQRFLERLTRTERLALGYDASRTRYPSYYDRLRSGEPRRRIPFRPLGNKFGQLITDQPFVEFDSRPSG